MSDLLLSVGGLLGREIAFDELLRRLVDYIATALGADRGTIYLVDRTKGEVFSKVAHLPELEEIRLQLGQGVAGFVADTGEVVNVPTSRTDSRFFSGVDERTGYQTESILAVPIRDREGAIMGVIQLLNKKVGSFPREDEAALEGLAREVGEALASTTILQGASIPLAARFNLILGESEPMRAAFRITRKAASTDATVLITGESGTGKELFARAIHVNSARRERPFVKVDCAALPESVIENELFGHERGAFTGADQHARGKFDVADKGTIFLDEIGELPLSVQGKLLRVLQDREFARVGSTKVEQVDVRVVVATNRDLESLVDEGRFRADLYYRVKVVQLHLPALRERGAVDVQRLVRHFVAAAAKRHGRREPVITGEAMERLLAHGWPGNVRELENCIESAVIMADTDRLESAGIPLPEKRERRSPSVVHREETQLTSGLVSIQTLDDVERAHIASVLAKVEGNQTLAARHLGIGRNTLARKMAKFGL